MQDSFESIPEVQHRTLLRLLFIKKMKRAQYFCTGSTDLSKFSHYALGIPLYTHFTSPIRRYCDLVVHRLLELCLKGKESEYTTIEVTQIAKQCNAMKNASKDAQDASQSLYLCTYISTLPRPQTALAFVNKIGTRSIDVVVFKYGIEKTMWVEDVMDEAKGLEQREGGLDIHWKSGVVQTIKMFTCVRVRIDVNMKVSPPCIKLVLMPDLDDDCDDYETTDEESVVGEGDIGESN